MRPYLINTIVAVVTLIIAFISYFASGARVPFVFAFLFIIFIPLLLKEKKLMIYIVLVVSLGLGLTSTGMAFRDGMFKTTIPQKEKDALRKERNEGNFTKAQEKYWRTVVGDEEKPRKVFNYAAIGLAALWGAGMYVVYFRRKNRRGV